MNYHRHQQTYRPSREDSQIRSRFDFILSVLVFAIIGCLLAWRG